MASSPSPSPSSSPVRSPVPRKESPSPVPSASPRTVPNYIGLVRVVVVDAKNIPAKDMNHSSDPFCVLQYGDISQRTTIKKKNLNPVWNEAFNFLATEKSKPYVMKIEVYDWDKVSKNDFIGTAILPGESIWHDPVTEEREYILPIKAKNGRAAGSLRVRARVSTPEEVEERFWLAVAREFDTDGSGSIARFELDSIVETLEGTMTSEEVEEVFREIDTDFDGCIRYTELLQWARKPGSAAKLLGRDDLVWKLSVFLQDERDAATVFQDVDRFLGAPCLNARPVTTSAGNVVTFRIVVRDRKTGQVEVEKISSSLKVAMRMMYSNRGGRRTVSTERVKGVLKRLTDAQGRANDDPRSRAQIAKFIDYHRINTAEILGSVEDFQTFNQFFYRKLKPGARPIDHPDDPNVAVSPADCRLGAFPTLDDATKIWIKGETFTLANLLQDDAAAAEFRGCSVVIARLSPQDYHRFHSPVDGTVGEMKPIDGAYYTVNPIAVRTNVDVFGENKRLVTWIDSPEFGRVMFIAVGATCVGSIVFTVKTGDRVKKGDEVGYFQFGGSTVILLFKAGSIVLDDDLVSNSSKPIETLVQQGFSIGHRQL